MCPKLTIKWNEKLHNKKHAQKAKNILHLENDARDF